MSGMQIKKTYPVNQLRDYSSLFMRSEVIRILNEDHSSINKKVGRYDKNLFNKDITYLKYYKYIYKVLGKYYPNEYFCKNEFINKWLKNELGNSDSVIFSEFRIGWIIRKPLKTDKILKFISEDFKKYNQSNRNVSD